MIETATTESIEALDPRIRRTRHLLQSALARLLEDRGLEKISVGEIAEAATLNRATFYDHYPDKFALLEDMVADRFADLLRQRGIFFTGQCTSAITGIVLATCDYLDAIPGIHCPTRRQVEQHLEPAIIKVVRNMILVGLRKHPPAGALSLEITAAAISGAIYAAASEWVRTPGKPPADQITGPIVHLVAPLFGGL